jgi:hypothetical protein
MADQPAAPPPAPPAPGPQGSGSVDFAAIIPSFVGVLTRPASFWDSVKGQTGLAQPLVFSAVMGLVYGVVLAIMAVVGLGVVGGAVGGAIGAAAGVSMIILGPIFAVIGGSFIGGAICHVVALIAGGKGNFEQSVRVASYATAVAPIAAVLAFIPVVRYLPSFYGLYLVALGIIALHLADRKKTFVVTGVLAGIYVLFIVVGLLIGAAARTVGSQINTQYGEGSEFQRELRKSAEEMRKAAEKMKEEAEKNKGQ